MAAKILDGRAISKRIRARVRTEVKELRSSGAQPNLVSLQVGFSNPSHAYLQSQRRACSRAGILYAHVSLDQESTEEHVNAHVRGICANPVVTGLIIQLPVPERIDVQGAYRVMDPLKDVEGMHPANLGSVFSGEQGLQPCTALAVMTLARAALPPGEGALSGAEVCVVGHSEAVGKPISMLFLAADATVTTCHVHTRGLIEKTRAADVLVVAAGKAGLIGRDHVREGAIVIDVGINYLGEGTGPVGDVCFDEVSKVAGAITPVPGGVGPVTVAMLLQNTVRAARLQRLRAAGRSEA
ncbi:MAG: bifunctional 5,10-methylenetetrahydrofolate dehydrogenase/5,10-methenyltetrahydrofolate cyclohydrolase [Planctomycetota bacterium]|jgi:methylenetetrahydrofolate dehydrogenase (NADP+)/methenyltetrahydrofolate cyclohydrolase